jgi:hypothetical protein
MAKSKRRSSILAMAENIEFMSANCVLPTGHRETVETARVGDNVPARLTQS